MNDTYYEQMLRERITELRIRKGVSEHRMSLELGKSGSYIRGISSGVALPSARELFNIIDYLDLTPAEFFAPMVGRDCLYTRLCERLRDVDEVSLKKVDTFLGWITEK